jgi:hypothetical protein
VLRVPGKDTRDIERRQNANWPAHVGIDHDQMRELLAEQRGQLYAPDQRSGNRTGRL